MSRAVPVVIILLLLVWAVLATMALNKATEDHDTERAAYVDSVTTLVTNKDELIRTLWDTVFARDAALDSLSSIRVNTVVLQDQARQDVRRMDMDSVFSILDAPPK